MLRPGPCHSGCCLGSGGSDELRDLSVGSESGRGTLTAVRDLGKGRHIFPSQSISLDGFSRRNSLSSIRAIKIDAEGSEAAFFRGAETILRDLRPILFIEFNDWLLQQAQTSAEQLSRTLVERGYSVFVLEKLRVESLNRSPMLSSQIVSAFRMNSQYQSCLN